MDQDTEGVRVGRFYLTHEIADNWAELHKVLDLLRVSSVLSIRPILQEEGKLNVVEIICITNRFDQHMVWHGHTEIAILKAKPMQKCEGIPEYQVDLLMAAKGTRLERIVVNKITNF